MGVSLMGGGFRCWATALLTGLTVVLPALPARAEVPPLVTDRPDFTESSSTVPPGHVQAEMGAEAGFESSQKSLTLPALLLRAGVLSNLELRLAAPSVAWTWVDGADAERAVGPLELGAKLVWPRGEAACGLLPYVSLPVQADDYDTVGVAAGLKGVWSVPLHSRLSLAGNLGLELAGLGAEESDVNWQGSGSLSLGIALAGQLGMFVESYALLDQEQVQVFGQSGFTYVLFERLQLDLYGGVLLNSPTAGVVGAGASVIL